MLNYDKMDEVLDNLEACADNLKNFSQTQTQFDKALEALSLTFNQIKEEKAKIEELIASVKQIEDTHNSIDEKIAVVLQDYKKLHSSFEYLELELKKNTAAISEINNALTKDLQAKFEQLESKFTEQTSAVSKILYDLKNDLQAVNALAVENKNAIHNVESELSDSKRRNKGLKMAVFAGIGISIITLVVSIVGLFI